MRVSRLSAVLAAIAFVSAVGLSAASGQASTQEPAETAEIAHTNEPAEVPQLDATAVPTEYTGDFITYTVARGDTLARIALKFNVSVSVIAQDNGIANQQLIYAGTQLRIRASEAAPTAESTTAATATPLPDPSATPTETATPTATATVTPEPTIVMTGEHHIHVVARGETLARIAVRYNTTEAELIRLNSLDNPDLIYVGQELIVPGKADAPTATPMATQPLPGATSQPETNVPRASFAYGVEVFYPSQNGPEVLVNDVQTLGMAWAKVDVDWGRYEPVQGQLDFTELDTLVDRLTGANIRILFTISGSPAWARGVSEESGPPDDFATFAAFTGALAAHYRGQVAAYEIWNEPNLRREWNNPLHPISAASYVELLRLAHGAIKQADPNALVISAGLAPTGYNDGVNALSDRLYLNALYTNGLADFTDAIGIHAGGWANPPDTLCCLPPSGISTHYEHPTFYFLNTLYDYRAIMDQHNDSASRLWITKFGWGTSQDTENPTSLYVFMNYTSLDEQASYLPRAFEMGYQLGYVEAMFLNNLNGCESDEASAEACYYALIGPDGQPRPAFSAVQTVDKTGQSTSGAPIPTEVPESMQLSTQEVLPPIDQPTAEATP